MCIPAEVRGQPQVSFKSHPTLFFESGFLTGTQNLALAPRSFRQLSPVSGFPPWEHRLSHHCARPLMWALRIALVCAASTLLTEPCSTLLQVVQHCCRAFIVTLLFIVLRCQELSLPRFTCYSYKFGQILLSLGPLNILRLLDPPKTKQPSSTCEDQKLRKPFPWVLTPYNKPQFLLRV